MASEREYKFFQSLFESENERFKILQDKGKVYISIITIYLAALTLKIDDIAKFAQTNKVPIFAFLAVGIIVVLALLFSILALVIRTYEGVTDPEELLKLFDKKQPSDEEFMADRMVDYAVATNLCSDENDKAANFLQLASWSLFAGVLGHLMIMVYTLL